VATPSPDQRTGPAGTVTPVPANGPPAVSVVGLHSDPAEPGLVNIEVLLDSLTTITLLGR